MSEDVLDVIHVYIKLNDKYFDESGFYSKEDLIKKFDLDQYNFNDLTFNSDIDKLKKVIEHKKLKLNDNILKELKNILTKLRD